MNTWLLMLEPLLCALCALGASMVSRLFSKHPLVTVFSGWAGIGLYAYSLSRDNIETTQNGSPAPWIAASVLLPVAVSLVNWKEKKGPRQGLIPGIGAFTIGITLGTMMVLPLVEQASSLTIVLASGFTLLFFFYPKAWEPEPELTRKAAELSRRLSAPEVGVFSYESPDITGFIGGDGEIYVSSTAIKDLPPDEMSFFLGGLVLEARGRASQQRRPVSSLALMLLSGFLAGALIQFALSDSIGIFAFAGLTVLLLLVLTPMSITRKRLQEQRRDREAVQLTGNLAAAQRFLARTPSSKGIQPRLENLAQLQLPPAVTPTEAVSLHN